MKLVFLDSTESDLRWFKRYYTRAFPEGRTNANVQFIKTRQLLLEVLRVVDNRSDWRT